MKKPNNKLIDKVISSLDWDSIIEVNKCFKIGIGEGTSVIPGIKRRVFSDTLNKNDIKSELKILLNYAIDNDLDEIFYGPWMIFWVNGEWLEVMGDDYEEDNEPISGDIKAGLNIRFDSSLEVIYSPQRIHVIGNTGKKDSEKDESDINKLESMLKKAIDTENFELATKIKDLLALQNGDASEDK
jgi:hypothetical protein